jgi:hypothetical protein
VTNHHTQKTIAAHHEKSPILLCIGNYVGLGEIVPIIPMKENSDEM